MAQLRQQLANHKWFSIFGGTALVAMGLIFATGAMARPFFFGGKPSPEKMQKHVLLIADDVMDDIDADDDQRREINGIISEAMENLAPQMKERAKTHETLLGELKKDAPDRAAIDLVLSAADKKREVTHAQIVDAVLDIHAVLNAEQRSALIERFEQRRGGHHGGFMH